MKANSTTVLPDVPLTPFVRDILGRIEASAGTVDRAISLPPECYTSGEWFEFEKRAIFDREWMALGHVSFIPNIGDYFSITILDEPLVVVRGKDGNVRVLSSVCRHRGHVLGEASGNAEAFTCPFHGWSYDLEGALISAPEMKGTLPFEELKRTQCLPSLRTDIWNGFIFVNFDGEAAPLGPRLKVLGEQVKNHNMAELVSPPTVDWKGNPWNWKFMQENALEPYHTHYLHTGPHDFAPSRLASFFDWDEMDDGAVFHPTGFLHLDGGFNASTKALMPTIPGLTDEERKRVMFAAVLPNLFFGAQPDCVFFFLILPESAGSITLRVGLLTTLSNLSLPTAPLLLKSTVDGISIFNDQDVVANTATHVGLKSRFAPRTRFAPKEQTLAQINTWLVKRYKAYAESLEPMAAAAE